MLDPGLVTAIAGVVLGGGAVQAVKVWKKAGSEAGAITAKTLIEVNEYLRTELNRRVKDLSDEITRRDEEIRSLRKRLGHLRKEFDALEEAFQKVSLASSP